MKLLYLIFSRRQKKAFTKDLNVSYFNFFHSRFGLVDVYPELIYSGKIIRTSVFLV